MSEDVLKEYIQSALYIFVIIIVQCRLAICLHDLCCQDKLLYIIIILSCVSNK